MFSERDVVATSEWFGRKPWDVPLTVTHHKLKKPVYYQLNNGGF